MGMEGSLTAAMSSKLGSRIIFTLFNAPFGHIRGLFYLTSSPSCTSALQHADDSAAPPRMSQDQGTRLAPPLGASVETWPGRSLAVALLKG